MFNSERLGIPIGIPGFLIIKVNDVILILVDYNNLNLYVIIFFKDVIWLITEEDIKRFQSKLNSEQAQKLLNFLSEENLSELKELARKKVKNKFIRPMRTYNKKYIDILYSKKDTKRETINLLNQTNTTLKNVHKLIINKSIVDANVLLRASFENLIMGMMITENENVYNEFINLDINDKNRKYTKPQYLRNHFRKIIRKIDDEIFYDISNTELKSLLDEFYNKLCLFTHSTLIVNAMVELKNDNIDIYIFALKQNAYFVEILLYLCLDYLVGATNNQINLIYILIGWCIILTDIDKEKIDDEHIKKLKGLMYLEINEDYFNEISGEAKKIKQEALKIQKEIELNPIIILEILSEIIK